MTEDEYQEAIGTIAMWLCERDGYATNEVNLAFREAEAEELLAKLGITP